MIRIMRVEQRQAYPQAQAGRAGPSGGTSRLNAYHMLITGIVMLITATSRLNAYDHMLITGIMMLITATSRLGAAYPYRRGSERCDVTRRTES
jgi:hypothetical protein